MVSSPTDFSHLRARNRGLVAPHLGWWMSLMLKISWFFIGSTISHGFANQLLKFFCQQTGRQIGYLAELSLRACPDLLCCNIVVSCCPGWLCLGFVWWMSETPWIFCLSTTAQSPCISNSMPHIMHGIDLKWAFQYLWQCNIHTASWRHTAAYMSWCNKHRFAQIAPKLSLIHNVVLSVCYCSRPNIIFPPERITSHHTNLIAPLVKTSMQSVQTSLKHTVLIHSVC